MPSPVPQRSPNRAGDEEIDLMIFYRGMPIAPTFTLRRDEVYIARIRDAVETFDYELRQLVKKIRMLGVAR